MMVRRRSVLSRLAFAVLVTFALASHHTGARADAYKIVQYKIRYPTSVNDEESAAQSFQSLPNTPAADAYYDQRYQPIEDYEYDQQTGYQIAPQESQPQPELTSRFGLPIALTGANSLSKYKQQEIDKQENRAELMQKQFQGFLKSLYDIERPQKPARERSQKATFQDPALESAVPLPFKMPQPMKKENSVDPLVSELFGIQNRPLEDAETMDKSSSDSETDTIDSQQISSNSNDDHYNIQPNSRLFKPINQESVSNQNYAEMEHILKRKLSSGANQASNGPALIKSEPNQASYDQYRQLAKSFVQSTDSNSNAGQSLLASMSDMYFVAMVLCVSSVAIGSVVGAGYCFYKVQQNNRQAAEVEFPAYGVIGPNVNGDCGLNSLNGSGPNSKCSSPPADRKLTQAAQMYHYQHQRQQMISNERNVVRVSNHGTANSDLDSDEENEDGEYTVYECPGLAPTGEMEVKNPLFQDDLTPMSSPSVLNGKPQNTKK